METLDSVRTHARIYSNLDSHAKAEVPPAGHLHRRLEGHGEERHEEVGEGEAHQEVVVDVPETPVEDDGDDDEHIVDDGEEDDGEDDGDLDYKERNFQVGVFFLTHRDVLFCKQIVGINLNLECRSTWEGGSGILSQHPPILLPHSL